MEGENWTCQGCSELGGGGAGNRSVEKDRFVIGWVSVCALAPTVDTGRQAKCAVVKWKTSSRLLLPSPRDHALSIAKTSELTSCCMFDAMWPLKARSHKYQAVSSDDNDSKDAVDPLEPDALHKQSRRRTLMLCIGGIGFVILLIALGVSANIAEQWSWSGSQGVAPASDEASGTTTWPSEDRFHVNECRKRREWRTLSSVEQQDYITAVLCLRNKPSHIAPDSNKTAYDDWPWIHSHVGYYSHHTASFLPWHRYFLHLYETTLREQCGYDGGLVYWDWTIDSDAIEHSPVFDSETGFGGDGEIGGEITVSNTGRCVVDGPFAGIVADYYDVKYKPHCLSRGFRGLDGSLGHIDGSDITAESMEEVLSSETYEEFVKLMESRVHDAIPYGISGDFETFTAPYDPLFFLHHTQLDRLWWLWQQRQPDNGLKAYDGPKGHRSREKAGLDDDIKMQALAKPVKVSELMDIHSEFLCYDY